MNRLYVVDPNLKNLTGHHFEYDRSLVDPALRRGYQFLALGHKDADDVIRKALPFAPAFSRTIWDTFPAVAAIPAVGAAASHLISNVSFYSVLRTWLTPAVLGADAVVLCHMIRPHQLLGWAWWFSQLRAAERPRLVLLFRYIPEWFVDNRFVRDAFRILDDASADGRVRLATDSDRLAADYARLLQKQMAVFPIPHTNPEMVGRSPRRLPAKRPHFVSVGSARDEKGILEVLESILALHARGALRDMVFTVQVNDIYAPKSRDAILDAIAEIRHLDLSNVTLVEASLPTADYYALLDSADVVLLPYWRSIYQARTSGILAEALGAGKVVIATEDTWLGDQIVTYGAGVLCADHDAAALTNAILEVQSRIDYYAPRAAMAQTSWLSTHNPDKFVESLVVS